MSSSDQDVYLDVVTDLRSLEEGPVMDAWFDLSIHAVDPILAQTPNMIDFVEQCLFFAIVKIYPESLAEEEEIMDQERMDEEERRVHRLRRHEETSKKVGWSVDGRSGSPSGVQPPDNGGSFDDFDDIEIKSSGSPSGDVETTSGSQGEEDPSKYIVGIVYLATSHLPSDASLGIAILAPWRGHGLGTQAAQSAMRWAFQDAGCHRLSSAISVSAPSNVRRFFQRLGFIHEGVRRRAIQREFGGGWEDFACLGVLDTEWVLREGREKPWSAWDELVWRHRVEREHLLGWEERPKMKLKKTTSAETIRETAAATMFFETDGETSEIDSVSTRQSSPIPSVSSFRSGFHNSPHPARSLSSSAGQRSVESPFLRFGGESGEPDTDWETMSADSDMSSSLDERSSRSASPFRNPSPVLSANPAPDSESESDWDDMFALAQSTRESMVLQN